MARAKGVMERCRRPSRKPADAAPRVDRKISGRDRGVLHAGEMAVTDQPAPKTMADLKLRVLSALVMAAGALAAAWLGGWPFSIIWLVAAALVASEFLTMAGARAYLPLLLSLVGVLLSGLWAHDMAQASPRVGPGAPLLFLMVIPVVCGVLAALASPAGRRRWAFLAGPCAALIAIVPIIARGGHIGGLSLVLWLFATVWFTDIAAYFSGRLLGGPKLWPAVSPKKTWSGAIGGAIAGAIGGVAIILWLGKPPLFASWSIFSVATFTLFASAVSQAGDLGESAMKRRFEVKDSSHLIPGHGGLMDRLDGFWAVCALLGVTILALEG